MPKNRRLLENDGDSKAAKRIANSGLSAPTTRVDDRPLRRITLHDKRRICIQRDWTENRCIRFQDDYPLDLSNLIDNDIWNAFIQELNQKFATIEQVTFGHVGRTLIGCFTCNLIRLFSKPITYKQLDDIDVWMERVNREEFIPRGVYAENPNQKAYRVLELILIYEQFEPRIERNTYTTAQNQPLLPRM